MDKSRISTALIFGLLFCVGLGLLGVTLSKGLIEMKALERTVVVKGLSEREVPADLAIFPIKFIVAANDLNELVANLQKKNDLVVEFLIEQGFKRDEITRSPPAITDKQAQAYGGNTGVFRYSGNSTISVYTKDIERVRSTQQALGQLGRLGIAIMGDDYQAKTSFIFRGLNTLKPEMIEEATRNAREVAEKFAADSKSRLGKIKSASQGQFSINDRDNNTPHIKRVRVVSTVTYYLSD
ncbi:MAG: SIMPL domain-containing protein [Candidatus Thiodiazotropha sp. (ex Myrtea sp. 'scaly one' KF741663)]|nr:SIMPL domain-containing protein [Candidatus Thiodiazotropha sp. (ex Myrtea sp. 'scaly one' KF741663)]